ncbi:MAG: hypothetical protein ABEH80_04595 [Halobaculum sp.]
MPTLTVTVGGRSHLDEADPGQPKRPLLADDGLEIDIPVTPSDGCSSAVAP